MSVIFGSARNDSRGKISGDKAGDNKQTIVNDYKGEVSMQPGYVHSKGWVILRPKTDDLANRLAYAMQIACNNKHLGYDQNNRLGVMKYGIETTVNTECDCSALVRACLKYCGINVGNFTTATAATVISGSGYFNIVSFTSLNKVQTGDILVTKTRGHIVICIAGVARPSKSNISYYAKYTGSSTSIVNALKAVGETNTTLTHRKKIAIANGIANYSGTASQNTSMINLLKAGKLVKA